ncbi:MAG TPA: type VII secretion protein EssC [Candidatus Intestinimonas pullistercoris]|uniref:Type VII secretion protein EssC n=1 Tax=Candidatus Intestinimonas pullistercoris TaxID=2838623 RepID=A0A9D2NYE6_9FIRM|nr:type VII secretion protein EssC [Candidatus Intestinimonas pullistercoris]
MLVRLITKERMFTMSLPQRVSGQYWLSDLDPQGRARPVASVEGVQGQWMLRGSSVLALVNGPGEEMGQVPLEGENQVVAARYRGDGTRALLFLEPATQDRRTFRKFLLPRECRIDIGRAPENQIVFQNQYASSHHACLIWQKGAWSVTDTQSSNGTFVNGRRIATTPLSPGDVVYIMGLKLIPGAGFLAVNDPDGAVRVSGSLQPLPPQEPAEVAPSYQKEWQSERFFRSPRFCRSLPQETLRVDPPPGRQKLEEVPLPLLLGPALTMGMTAVIMGGIAVNNLLLGETELLTALPTLAMSVSMLAGTLLWPMLTKRHEKKKRLAAETMRQEKYLAYLDEVRNQIYAISTAQKEILMENAPSLESCRDRVRERRRDLWERTAGHEDFLRLRLGLGTLPLSADLRFPEEKFSLEDDHLFNSLFRLAREPKLLQDVPVTCSLREQNVIGVVGGEGVAGQLLQGLLLQIAALHGSDEVKLVFLTDGSRLERWGFLRWLPHVWSDRGEVRFFAVDDSEGKALSAQLERTLSERLQEREKSRGSCLPHYVLVALGMDLAGHTEIFRRALSAPAGAGFSCLVMASSLQELPRECSVVVELEGEEAVIYDKNDPSGQRQTFRPELLEEGTLEPLVRTLAGLELDSGQESFVLPTMLTFLELYHVGKVEHLNALTRWKENDPVNSLEVPVGLGTGGDPFYLDLHEKFHGPHGLVAGMTGSGKSEFIITYILSLAVNFHPDEVAFILIDYKGGGLAGAFEDPEKGIRLPHLAGTITNLDGPAVNRSLVSIQSELRRRQAIFNEARQVSGEGTIDIYKYQKMHRAGLVKEAVPHLFIISDEFAELKAQQPEFMAQLISAARIGRSLGVHLILATQKPSGVVDDQIWSNSRFRVCLKVQERADSMDMLKRPDAAALAETGRFYLQVGFNELFALGQSAWCGAPYVPVDRVEKKRDERVAVLDHLGRVLSEASPRPSQGKGSGLTQVVAVVRYLSDLAEGEGVSARRLWLPPIPAVIYLRNLREKYHWHTDLQELEPVIGEFDDPFRQAQGLLTLPFSRKGNALVYGATGGGKTTLLNTLLYGLLSDYGADRLHVYLVDLGEETLRAFEQAPQVGGVLFSGEEERVANLFKLLQAELARRKKLLAEDDGDYRRYGQRTGTPVPHILVVIRNYAAFAEQFENLEDALLRLTREGSKYGIYFLLTANSANAVRYRLTQNFAQTFALQLNDRADYISLLDGTDGVYPSKLKGRGVFKTDRTYEFQTAHMAPEDDPTAIRAFAAALAEGAEAFAPPVPSLPEHVTPETFPGPVTLEAFPVGVEKTSLRPAVLDLSRGVVTFLLGRDADDLSSTAQGFVRMLRRIEGLPVTVLDGAAFFPAGEEERLCQSGFEPWVEELFQEMVRRNNTYKTAANEGRPLPVFDPQCYVITGIGTILEGLDEAGRDKLRTLLEKAEVSYGIHFLLCDSAKDMAAHTGEPWYRRQVRPGEGIWAGDGISDQNVLKPSKLGREHFAELPPHFGYLLRRGKTTLVKLLEAEGTEGGEAE